MAPALMVAVFVIGVAASKSAFPLNESVALNEPATVCGTSQTQ
jgi:hypothetical protein